MTGRLSMIVRGKRSPEVPFRLTIMSWFGPEAQP
jgi:hypothetical protein